MNGTYDFTKDLEKLGRKLGVKTIKAAQKEALKPLAALIKSSAPSDSGELKSSIKSKVGKRKKGSITTVVNISTPEDNPHAGYVEFGTRETPADPFIRPAAKRLKPEIVNKMIELLDSSLRSVLK